MIHSRPLAGRAPLKVSCDEGLSARRNQRLRRAYIYTFLRRRGGGSVDRGTMTKRKPKTRSGPTIAEAGRTLDDSDDAQGALDTAMYALGGV